MDRPILVGLSIVLVLPSAARLHAESTPAVQGYYYYPQPTYYAPYAPYGYQAPGYPSAPAVQAPAPTPAKVETPKTKATTAEPGSAPNTLDQGRYIGVRTSQLETVANRFKVEHSRLGSVLATPDGRTLYMASANQDDRLASWWSPYLAGEKDAPNAPFGVLQRADGRRQWTHDGKALYLWSGDQGAGDVTGDGVDGTWHAVRVRRG